MNSVAFLISLNIHSYSHSRWSAVRYTKRKKEKEKETEKKDSLFLFYSSSTLFLYSGLLYRSGKWQKGATGGGQKIHFCSTVDGWTGKRGLLGGAPGATKFLLSFSFFPPPTWRVFILPTLNFLLWLLYLALLW